MSPMSLTPPTVVLDDTLRAAMARAAEQNTRASGRPAGVWIPKPPVLPSIPLRARRAPRPSVLAPGKMVCRRAVGVQLPLFDSQ